MGWIKDKLYRLWAVWSTVQEREDEVWRASVEDTSAKESEGSEGEEENACSAGESAPDLMELVKRRNEQLRRNSH